MSCFWLLPLLLLLATANCFFIADVGNSLSDSEVVDDNAGILKRATYLRQSPLKRLRPCFYSPIQCLMKRANVHGISANLAP
uniref:Secreted protein n=1 Tax=Ascaris lumbricoides TaxID=6252 RepID=A0A0M3I645_ASCLU